MMKMNLPVDCFGDGNWFAVTCTWWADVIGVWDSCSSDKEIEKHTHTHKAKTFRVSAQVGIIAIAAAARPRRGPWFPKSSPPQVQSSSFPTAMQMTAFGYFFSGNCLITLTKKKDEIIPFFFFEVIIWRRPSHRENGPSSETAKGHWTCPWWQRFVFLSFSSVFLVVAVLHWRQPGAKPAAEGVTPFIPPVVSFFLPNSPPFKKEIPLEIFNWRRVPTLTLRQWSVPMRYRVPWPAFFECLTFK